MTEAPRFHQQPWKHDVRSKRFSHERFFGSATNFVPEFMPDSGPPHDQGMSLRCTGYGNAVQGYLIHGIPMNPDWSAAKVGQKQGRSVDEMGGDPNACMKSMRDDGFLPLSAASYTWRSHGYAGSGMNSWNRSLDDVARKYDTAIAFFKVDGPHDVFDNIRNAITLAYDNDTMRGPGVDAFGRWFHPWTDAPGGIITDTYKESDFAGYHRWVFFGWKQINGVTYLAAKNSYGSRGDNGVYYFPRQIVNREFTKWGTTLKVLKTVTPEQLAEARKQTPLGKLWETTINLWYIFSERFGLYA